MFVTDNRVVYVPDIKSEIMDYETIVQDLDLENENIYEAVPLGGGRKRMRLHQLTWEEKLQRKKMRNRIAAQTSRDRKKAKMDHLEEAVKELKQQNEMLFMQVEELKKKNEMLIDANAELQKALTTRSYTCSCLTKFERDGREKSNEVHTEICVKDDHSCDRPAESYGFPQQKGEWTALAQMLADFKGDTFLDDLERLAASLLEEVEQHEDRRNPTNVLDEVSGGSQQECISVDEMVGPSSEMLESSRCEINSTSNHRQHCFELADLTVEEHRWLISLEHSYAHPSFLPSSGEEFGSIKHTLIKNSIPNITVSESEKVSAIENELKRELEVENKTNSITDTLSIPSFPNFSSPKSEVSSDLGYESLDSPYGSEISRHEGFSDLLGDSLSELFPDLL